MGWMASIIDLCPSLPKKPNPKNLLVGSYQIIYLYYIAANTECKNFTAVNFKKFLKLFAAVGKGCFI